MALPGFGAKAEDVMALMAKKSYTRAIEVLRAQIEASRHDSRLRMQLADVLMLAGKEKDAVTLLVPLADEFARDGFAAKAIAVLKKIQRIDPGRRDVDSRLASLIQQRQVVAAAAETPAGLPEIGMEEIGLDFASGVSVAAPPSEPVPASEPPPPAEPAVVEPVIALPEPAIPLPEPPIALPEPPVLRVEPMAPEATMAMPDVPIAQPEPSRPRSAPVIEDPDLLYLGDIDDVALEDSPMVEAEPLVEAEPDPMSDGRFAEELQALVDGAFLSGFDPSPEEAAPAASSPKQIVVSPLFRNFSVDEMVAVIQGLKLLSFKRGDVILREGAAGDSLYMLTTGMVRAFRKDPTGRQVRLGDLSEGAFFGEVSILTGGRRTATVAALTPCELLELDRVTLDSIRETHPHVWDVLEEFARQRGAARPS